MADSNEETKSGKGLKDWLPLILTTLAMPGLAYAMTSMVLLPKLAAVARPAVESDGVTSPGSEGEAAAAAQLPGGVGQAENSEAPKPKFKPRPSLGQRARFSKTVVGLRGGEGKQLLTQFTVASDLKDFEKMVNRKKDHLLEQVGSVMESFTFKQIEASDGRGDLRTNLIAAINDILETNAVKALYFTEFAVQ